MGDYDYKNLDVWKEARKLVSLVYQKVQNYPEDEKFGLISQMKRSSISIPSNIAEGIGRNTQRETARFFYIAKGSLYELETQLYLSTDLNFLNENEVDELLNQLVTVRKLIIGFIKHLEKTK